MSERLDRINGKVEINAKNQDINFKDLESRMAAITRPQELGDDEAKDVDEEIVMEEDSTVKTPVTQPKPAVTPETKPYKPKVPFPQRFRKAKLKEQYDKFVNMIKNVHINVPLVDLIQGMLNYAKFIKELVTDKGKLNEVKATFLNAECSAIVQNHIPPKLEDPGSFLITCSIRTLTCKALADLGAGINLMPYSVWSKLALGALRPTRMSIRLADHSF
uniref:uncharacterized protein LOC122609029 n=1 Tax=Erigeron canadensis TaxID=72917 RepID=UPI001CB8F105|nr:uncharacterized protein LOC122609029 [Erigeron canadensis]